MKKLKIHGVVKEESGVIAVFYKLHKDLGFDKIVPSTSRGFDIDSIEYKGIEVTVEFEYRSSNFLAHQHPNNMLNNKKYVVICWYDDCDLKKKIKESYNKELYDVICLESYVEIELEDNKNVCNQEEIKYMILSYNPKQADYRTFSEWENSKIFRTSCRFQQKHIPKGSKILIKQGDYIIGGFDVVRYEYIEFENFDEKEWQLYKILTDYPVTLYTTSEDELKTLSNGHIFYENFISFEPVKISFSGMFPDINIPRDGRVYLTKEQYEKIIK